MWCLRLAIVLLALPAVSAHEFTLAHLKNALFEKAMALAGLGQTIHYMKGGETPHQHDHQRHKHWHEKMRKKMEEAHKCHSKCGVHAACHSKCPKPWAPFVKACQDFPAIKACYATCKDAECNNCPKFEVAWMNKKLAKHPEKVIKEGEAKCPRLLEAHACHKTCAPGDYDCHQKCPMFHGRDGGGALGADDVCYRFCEDSSQPAVSQRTGCPAGTTCRTTMASGMVSFDTCHSPDTCQPEASKGGTEIPVVNTDDEDGDEEDIERDHQDPVLV